MIVDDGADKYPRGRSPEALSMSRLGRSLALPILLIGFRLLQAAPSDVVINEILYHPDPDNTGGEFVELFNGGDTAVDMGGWSLAEAIGYDFPADTVVDAGAYLVVAKKPEAAQAFYGIETARGPFDGRLNNAGETVLLQDDNQQVIDSVPYDDQPPWPSEADGGGPSLELVDPTSDNSAAGAWALGQSYSPGAPNAPTVSGVREVTISEIMYKPLRQEPREAFGHPNSDPGPYIETDDDEFGEFVEIFNRTESVVDLSGWTFSEGIIFEFSEGTALEPGTHLVVAADPDMLKARLTLTNVVGPFEGRLRDGGERITLRDQDLLLVDTVRYNDKYPWPTAPDEFGVSLESIAPSEDNSTAANWRSSTRAFPTPPLIFEDVEEGGGDGWIPLTALGRTISRTNQTMVLMIFVNGPGEWLVDEIKLTAVADDLDLLAAVDGPDGSFEMGDDGWERRGNHETSFWTDQEAKEGVGSEHLVATGNGSVSNSLRVRLRGIPPGTQFLVSLWAKHVKGDPRLEIRVLGGALQMPAQLTRPDLDLARDWSDNFNPSGFWEYRDGNGEMIESRAENWLPADLGEGQPAWAAGDGEAPGWAKSVGKAVDLDFPEGAVGGYGPAELWWVSPELGKVTISGGAFLLRDAGSDQTWELKVNERSLSTGTLLSGVAEESASTPMPFESGSGGADALTLTVKENDVIKIVVGPVANGQPDFVGLDVRVSFRVGSEPSPPVGGGVGLGTPGYENSVASDVSPPFVDAVQHFPNQPMSTDEVTVRAEITSPVALKSVELGLEVLHATTIEVLDPMPMFDDGAHDDAEAGDGVYGVQVPAKESQTLVHYWVSAEDVDGRVTRFPYDGESSPSLAYFHYDNEVETQQTTYHFFMSAGNLNRLRQDSRSNEYLDASIVIDDRRPGKEEGPIAYPHILARHRGAGSRSNPRHQWKLKFNRSKLYDHNRVVDTMLNLPLVQHLGFVVFGRAGIANLESDVVRFYLNGRQWDYYLAFESPNATWAAKHGHGNETEAYKARSVGTVGQAKNSDLYRNQLFTNMDFWGAWNKKLRPLEPPVHIRQLTDAVNDFPDDELLPWLDANVDLEQVFSRWGINILLNLDDFAGHNFYLFRPEDGKWKLLGYDFDSLGRMIAGALGLTYGDGSTGSPDWQRNKLLQRVAANRTLKRIHALNMRRMVETFFTEQELFPLLDEVARRMDPRIRSSAVSAARHLKTQIRSQRGAMRTRWLPREQLPGQDEVPVIDPPGGEFSKPVTVSISTPPGWRATYTVDGSDPRLSDSATVYAGPISVLQATTVRAASITEVGDRPHFRSGNWTDIAEERYEISDLDGVNVFVRGDFSLDKKISTTDVVQILFHLFKGEESECRVAGDANNDDRLDIGDAIYLVDYLFRQGTEPAAPFPQAGVDPDGSSPLECSGGVEL